MRYIQLSVKQNTIIVSLFSDTGNPHQMLFDIEAAWDRALKASDVKLKTSKTKKRLRGVFDIQRASLTVLRGSIIQVEQTIQAYLTERGYAIIASPSAIA